MQIYERNNKIIRIVMVLVLSLIIIGSAAQGIFKDNTSDPSKRSTGEQPKTIGYFRGESTFEWKDEFLDTSKIDGALSYNYDIGGGVIQMANTYEAWASYPEWERMKPISVMNTGADTLFDYVLDITIPYDGDMQIDFDDIRFADENSYSLTYWIGDLIWGVSVDMLVRIPELPAQETTTIYMFYGNPLVDDESDDTIFTWMEITDEDLRLSWTLYTEGAWDPDVAYGSSKFIVAWEEGAGPGYSPDQNHRLLQRQIHVRLLDTDGGNPIPDYPDDIDISTATSNYYHAENPSIAFSEDSQKFLVVWEENPTLYKYGVGIKGAFITTSGFDYYPFTICDPSYSGFQYYPCHNPCVAYDEQSDRFFVVWTKSDTSWDYDVYGKFYGPNGSQIGPQIHIASGSSYEGQPWVCSDNQGRFMVVYEEGVDASNGPFSLKAKLYEYDGGQVGGTIDVANGSSNTDNMFPSVSFNSVSENYLITWNTGDASSSDYNGAIKGMLLNENGNPLDTAIIQSGSVYKIANGVPYLGSRFFVTYDDDYGNLDSIWGRLIGSDGNVISNRPELSDDLDFDKGFANSVVGEGNIFVAWEDERLDLYTPPTEIRGSIWYCPQSTESQDISFVFGGEEELILEAIVVSIAIEPEDFIEWDEFSANATYVADTSLSFDILDGNGTILLLGDISPGEDLTNITESVIRLQARFNRDTPKNTSVLDSWLVLATVGSDIESPWTEIVFDPELPDGDNGWYVTPININLYAYDNDSIPENVTTYYRINGGDVETYEPESIIVLSTEGANNSIEFWSSDNAGNEELPHNIIEGIKIDTTSPFVTILEPPDLVFPGEIFINGTVTEYSSGSGIDRILIRINGELVFNATFSGENFVWFDWQFTADYGEIYDIHVEAYDKAGNKGEDHKTTICSDRGLYEPGCIYLFDNPKIGPLALLTNLDVSVAVDYGSLYIIIPEVHENATSIEFVAKQIILEHEFSTWDTNLSDGCSCEFDLPSLGFYKITAYAYDDENALLDEYLIISQMLVILLS